MKATTLFFSTENITDPKAIAFCGLMLSFIVLVLYVYSFVHRDRYEEKSSIPFYLSFAGIIVFGAAMFVL